MYQFNYSFLGTAFTQEFTFAGQQKKQTIRFKFIKNLIIIPIYVNNKGLYDFVLNTGVGPMIIIDFSIIDSLNFNKMRKIKRMSLAQQDPDAYILSQTLTVKIVRAELNRTPLAILKEDLFNK